MPRAARKYTKGKCSTCNKWGTLQYCYNCKSGTTCIACAVEAETVNGFKRICKSCWNYPVGLSLGPVIHLHMKEREKLDQQKGRCYICNGIIDYPYVSHKESKKQSPMLKLAHGRLDNSIDTFDYDDLFNAVIDFDNMIVGHRGCILAKDEFSMEDIGEWLERIRSTPEEKK